MAVDVEERELLAQLVFVAVVRVDVDRLSKKKRFVESVELLLNRFRSTFKVNDVATDLRLPLLPRAEYVLLHEPHVARRGLQILQLVDEQPFQLRLADVDGAALTPAVVIRVPAVTSFRPARSQRPAAPLAANESFQREIGPAPLVRTRHLNASFEDCLNTVEGLLADKRFKIAAPRHVEFRNMNQAGVQPIREHPAEALRVERQPLARAETKSRNFVQDFFFRESASGEFLEGPRHERAALWIWRQAFA